MEGQTTESIEWKRSASYGPGPMAFFKILEEWREKGEFEGLELKNDEGAVVDLKVSHSSGEVRLVNGTNGHTNGLSNGVEAAVAA